MAQIWRVAFPVNGRAQEVVLVDAGQLHPPLVSQFPMFAQQVLGIKDCKCETNWPFQDTLDMNEFLEQVDHGRRSSHATYLQHKKLCAVGLGSNKTSRKRAGLLALAIASLLQDSSSSAPPELKQYFQMARKQSVKQVRLRPGKAAPVEREEQIQPVDEPDKHWLPASGSWIWWMDQHTLAVLCEDVGADIFASAAQWLLEVAGSTDCQEENGRNLQDFRRQIKGIFPDILWHPTLFSQTGCDYQIVGMGRDIKHRRRAAYLGFAALRSQECHLDLHRSRVVDEVNGCKWFPHHRLERFYDLDACGFWLNMCCWQKCNTYNHPLKECELSAVGKPFSKPGLSDIRMSCQPALLTALEQGAGYAEIDLTKMTPTFPWPKIIAGHKERCRIAGQGVIRFAIVADEEQFRDEYQECDKIHFVVDTVDGKRHTFDSLQRTHETKWAERTPKDETLAFRHAAGWAVKRRWDAFHPHVFQNLIQDFKSQVRPNGWEQTDWEKPSHKSERHAWKLSWDLRTGFNRWLGSKTITCEALEHLRSAQGDWKERLDEAVAGLCAESDPTGSWRGSWQWRDNSSRDTFYPVQKALLDIALQQDQSRELLRPLDPSVCGEAEEKYGFEWRTALDDIRFSHDNISEVFRRGGHYGKSLGTLIDELVSNPYQSQNIPALVAVRLEADGPLIVIMGNRRLRCYKDAWNRGAKCWFKIVIHDYPKFEKLERTASFFVLHLKVIQAMSSHTQGEEVKVLHRHKRARR